MMNSKRWFPSARRAGVLLLWVSAGLGCSTKEALTEAEFCERKAGNECAGVAADCAATKDACEAVRLAACQAFGAAQQAAPATPATRPFQPDKAEACLNKAKEVYAKAVILPADRAALDDVCARVYSPGKKSTDTDNNCTRDYECDTNLVCDPGFLKCATKTQVTGGFCNNPGDICPAGQYCMAGSPRMCVARPGMGQACDATTPCADAFRCAADVCAARVPAAGACTSDGDCATTAPYCDTYNGNICTTGFVPSTKNAECVAAFGA